MMYNPLMQGMGQNRGQNQLGGRNVAGPQPMIRPAVRPIGMINRDPSLGYGTGGLEPRPPLQTGGPEPRPPMQTGGAEPRPTGVMPTVPPQYGTAPGVMSPRPMQQKPFRGWMVPQMMRSSSGAYGDVAGFGAGIDPGTGMGQGIDSANGLGHSVGNGPAFGNSNAVGQTPSPTVDTLGLLGYSGISPFGVGYGQVTPSTPSTPTGPIGRPGIGPLGYAPAQGYGYNPGYGGYGEGPAPGSDPNGYGGFANNGYGSMGYGVTPGGLAGYDANGNAVAAGSVADAYGGYAGGYGGGYGGGDTSGGYGGDGGGYGNGGVGGNDNDHG